MSESSRCPEQQVLQRLVLGELAEEEAERLARHLENCPRCAATLHVHPVEDTLIEAARAHAATGGEPRDDVVESLIALLVKLPLAAVSSDETEAGSEPYAAPNPASLLAPPQEPGELGRLGAHKVLRVLGVGGMGTVFEAEDISLQRRVALKVLNPILVADLKTRQRFLREAQAAAAIYHDNVVTVHQAGEDRGIIFLAMQLLAGETLEDRLRRAENAEAERLSVREVVRIGAEVAEGLVAVHAIGLIHRDIKPSNIWLEPNGRAKILDFGLARAVEDEASLTDPGMLIGTPSHLAPELLKGAATDGRSDLFALGCVLYRMLTGVTPFRGANKSATLLAIASAAPLSPHALNPAIPPALSELVLRLLAKDPADRPSTAEEAALLLRQAADPAAPCRATAKRKRIRRLLPLGAACLAAACLATAALFHVTTSLGTFVLEVDDPDLAIRLNAAGGVVLHDRKTERVYTLTVGKHDLPTGEYDLDVSEADGPHFSTRRFTLKRGGEVKVTAFIPKEHAAATAAQKEWHEHTAALPAGEQLEAIAARLKELNPEFDGVLGPRIERGVIVELGLLTDHVSDISPLRALSSLEILSCRGSAPGRGQLTDLSPLEGMRLTYLDCSANPHLHDLAPLRGMPMWRLVCWSTGVADLGPLRDMPLKSLDVNRTLVTDLEPVAKLPLTRLLVRSRYFSPAPAQLAAMPLQEIELEFNPERHARVLRSIPSLEKINEQPAEQFLKAAEAGQAELETFIKMVATLPPDEQATAVAAKLREFNPGFDGRMIPTLDDGAVVELRFFSDAVTDLRPLRALTRLRRLHCYGTAPSKSSLFDLWPLEGLPLETLDCSFTNVTDLAPLKSARLGALLCAHTPVRDLSPLHGQPLIYLDCRASNVVDLTPVKGSALLYALFEGCRINDFSPVEDMPIQEISGDFQPDRDTAVLRSLHDLRKINGAPAARLWKRWNSGKSPG